MAQTVLYGALEAELAGADADGERLWIPLEELERATGWTAKPEGLCRGETCVPVPAASRAEAGGWIDGERGRLDFAAFAAHLGHAVARDDQRGVWAFGPAATEAPRGELIEAPELRLPDLDGAMHSLSDYRGKKVLLYCWSSW